MMKIILCLCFCQLSIALSAQSAVHTFTSSDGAFQFKYSSLLIRCVPEEAQTELPNNCVCDDHTGSITIACFTRPSRNEHFLSAFFVAEVQAEECMEHWPNTPCKQQPIRQNDCLAGPMNWWPPDTPLSARRGESTKIGSIPAKHFQLSNAGLGHYEASDIYRVFHNNKCYDLGIEELGVNSTGFDLSDFEAITKIANEDHKKYGPLLSQALHSFHFLTVGQP